MQVSLDYQAVLSNMQVRLQTGGNPLKSLLKGDDPSGWFCQKGKWPESTIGIYRFLGCWYITFFEVMVVGGWRNSGLKPCGKMQMAWNQIKRPKKVSWPWNVTLVIRSCKWVKHLHWFMNVVSHQILLYRSLFFFGACRFFFFPRPFLGPFVPKSLSERCQDDRQGLGKVRIPDMLTQKNWLVGWERHFFWRRNWFEQWPKPWLFAV